MISGTQYFADRRDAGRQLAMALAEVRLDHPLVLALPRGGVPVAFEVAQALGAQLELLLVRKIGAPHFPEYGIGAVVDGSPPQIVLNEDVMAVVRPSPEYLKAETNRQLAEIERRRKAYMGSRSPVAVAARTVILVDDGIATGGTAKAALLALRKAGAGRIILAVPVAPKDKLDELAAETDETICLFSPEQFRAVGLHYADFSQTTDGEVIRLLKAVNRT